VSLVWADDDDAVPPYVAERAAALLGERATLSVVPGAGHLLPLTTPAALRAAITAYLP
jgi:pimeloyl-ACP methyl ester carboxylesterase